MTTRNGQPPMIPGCDVLPPMELHEPSRPPTSREKPKLKPNRRKTGNRFAVLNSFVDTAAAKLSRSEILVWMILYRDTRNDISRTSQVDIARRAGTSTRTVCRAINRLRKRGLLIMIYQGGLNRGPSKYKVLAE